MGRTSTKIRISLKQLGRVELRYSGSTKILGRPVAVVLVFLCFRFSGELGHVAGSGSDTSFCHRNACSHRI